VLSHLSIKSLTLVDQLELEFNTGMSVITGETGAGKSILLGALGLALGDRADSSLIATGAAKTEVNAIFDLQDHTEALAWLTERELIDGDQCILRRVVSRDGRSRAFVNGSSTTLQELKTLSEMLLDIHSQHEHQSLLKKETHERMLDEFGGLTPLVSEVRTLFKSLSAARHKLLKTRTDAEEQSARVQLLSYQAEELATLAIQPDETAQLENELKRLSSAGEIQEKLTEALALCNRETDSSASTQLTRTLRLLSDIEDNAIRPIVEMLASALIQLDEATSDLLSVSEKFESNPIKQREVEGRLSDIYEIARKHKIQPDELATLTNRIQDELDQILNAETIIKELEQQVATAETEYQVLAEKLTKSRLGKAKRLQPEVTKGLQGLGMDGAKFEVSLGESPSWSQTGMDDIEFRISTIPGSKPGALAKIASGGELSRISLAIQVITARTSRTPTLIFDEVDVGVGGATAEVVGSLLRKLGEHAQIICVTHLPQVAAQGHQHYVVAKSTTKKSATTTVVQLGEEEKVDEIARMLGGVEKTDLSLAHAEAMLSRVESPQHKEPSAR
jgi:DNA repair protein RecN (Recombination protein N)